MARELPFYYMTVLYHFVKLLQNSLSLLNIFVFVNFVHYNFITRTNVNKIKMQITFKLFCEPSLGFCRRWLVTICEAMRYVMFAIARPKWKKLKKPN